MKLKTDSRKILLKVFFIVIQYNDYRINLLKRNLLLTQKYCARSLYNINKSININSSLNLAVLPVWGEFNLRRIEINLFVLSYLTDVKCLLSESWLKIMTL